MKKISLIIVLSLCFTFLSQADDIKDFQIEGISIGDSLLNYYDEKKIKNMKKTFYPKSDKYYLLDGIKIKNQKEYEVLSFHLKKNDNQYKLSGREFDAELLISNYLTGENTNNIFERFENINSKIFVQFNNIFIDCKVININSSLVYKYYFFFV